MTYAIRRRTPTPSSLLKIFVWVQIYQRRPFAFAHFLPPCSASMTQPLFLDTFAWILCDAWTSCFEYLPSWWRRIVAPYLRHLEHLEVGSPRPHIWEANSHSLHRQNVTRVLDIARDIPSSPLTKIPRPNWFSRHLGSYHVHVISPGIATISVW